MMPLSRFLLLMHRVPVNDKANSELEELMFFEANPFPSLAKSRGTGAPRKETVPAAPWLPFPKENWKPNPDLEGLQNWAEDGSRFHDFGCHSERGPVTKSRDTQS